MKEAEPVFLRGLRVGQKWTRHLRPLFVRYSHFRVRAGKEGLDCRRKCDRDENRAEFGGV
ncbi:hypothetical protein [Alicyclobacillus tolerans]|uniref:hypothetical protein n=1 Tax=Alicyclobacillus tolerans TaxID=90970 RepID=UPI003B987824